MLQIKKETKKRESPEAPAPDSTTVESKSYICGEEVLVHLSDERFYLGFIAKLRYKDAKCLVKFGDNTVKWVFLKHVTRMTCANITAQFCSVCNIEVMADDLCVCDKCANAYHRKCHKPEVTVSDITVWICSLCKEKQQISKQCYNKQVTNPVSSTIVPKNIKLPYDLNSLQWDIHHRINNLGTYCYCGGPGDWFIKMLQCGKCLQWFHEKCVTSLIFPLYLGDRFYIFLCSVCNIGTEFVRRIEMEWPDLVHLSLFNMTAFKPQKYYDVDINILPYLDQHWSSLYLPPSILNVPVDDRKVYVINALLKDTNQFEFQGKKPTNMWGLRLKLPPKPPRFTLPAEVPINENILHHQLRNKLNLKILPPPKKTDPIINERSTEPMYSVEGLKFLHQDSHVVMLPKGLPSIGHNVCIKSASPIVPAPRSIIERRIRQQQIETNKRSSSVITNKIKKSIKKEKVPESRSPSRSTESTPEKYASGTEEELTSEAEADVDDDEDIEDEDEADADSLRATDLQSRRSQRLSVNRLLNGRTMARSSLPREARSASSITLPLSLAPVITQPQVRTTKRRLSEKDLRVDRNGQYLVKRKRLRRNGLPNNSLTPTKRQSKNNNCNGRPMYKSYSDFFANHGHSVNRPCSPDNPIDSSADLKTLVHSYFGASNRIANGEEYTILCKRTNPDGSEEFLIRWD